MVVCSPHPTHSHTYTFHKPQPVPIAPKMVHMVKNKHNFKSHGMVDRPLAMKTMCGMQA